jgi:hypothetical protein
LQAANIVLQSPDFFSHPQPEIKSHLVIPRPGRMQFRSCRNALRQFRLDIHVHVFELALPLEFPGFDPARFVSDIVR